MFFLLPLLGLVWFSCIPSFNFLLCQELVKTFTVVVGGWKQLLCSSLVQTLNTRILDLIWPKLNNNFYPSLWKIFPLSCNLATYPICSECLRAEYLQRQCIESFYYQLNCLKYLSHNLWPAWGQMRNAEPLELLGGCQDWAYWSQGAESREWSEHIYLFPNITITK